MINWHDMHAHLQFVLHPYCHRINSNSTTLHPVQPTNQCEDLKSTESPTLLPAQLTNESKTTIKTRELAAWILVACFFIVLLTIIILIAITTLCVYYRRMKQTKENSPDYKMEGNPCYEAITLRKTTAIPHIQTHDYI